MLWVLKGVTSLLGKASVTMIWLCMLDFYFLPLVCRYLQLPRGSFSSRLSLTLCSCPQHTLTVCA